MKKLFLASRICVTWFPERRKSEAISFTRILQRFLETIGMIHKEARKSKTDQLDQLIKIKEKLDTSQKRVGEKVEISERPV